MRFYAVFLILNLQLGHIYADTKAKYKLSDHGRYDKEGYECGSTFFTLLEINDFLQQIRKDTAQKIVHPQIFQRDHIGETNYKDYYIWPIKKEKGNKVQTQDTGLVFGIVFSLDNVEPVYLVAKTSRNNYIKCIWIKGLREKEEDEAEDTTNGFLCGERFFSDYTIDESLNRYRAKSEWTNLVPRYVGNMYPKKLGYVMWPVSRNLWFLNGKISIGPNAVILNSDKNLVDVVARGYNHNFMRCIRSKKLPKAPASDPHSNFFAQPPKPGYLCGRVFFNNAVLIKSAAMVKGKFEEAKHRFPKKIHGLPVNPRDLIQQICTDGSLAVRANRGPYHLFLTQNFGVEGVAVSIEGRLTACQESTIASNKNHDTSSYQCYKRLFFHQELATAAELACEMIISGHKSTYPLRYKGPDFMSSGAKSIEPESKRPDLSGPYFTYPVLLFGAYTRYSGPYRVVINKKCEIVGAITMVFKDTRNGQPNEFMKCHRMDDGELPPNYFNANRKIISELEVGLV